MIKIKRRDKGSKRNQQQDKQEENKKNEGLQAAVGKRSREISIGIM